MVLIIIKIAYNEYFNIGKSKIDIENYFNLTYYFIKESNNRLLII